MNNPTMPVPHGGSYTIEELEQVAQGTHVIVDRKVVPKSAEAPAPASEDTAESDPA